MGPILFLLYINDLADLFGPGLSVKLFADDVKIYAVINDVSDIDMLQAGLDLLFNWSVDWQLPISINKCNMLHLGRSNGCHTYHLDSTDLPNVNNITDLGVLLDSNLRFIKHYRLIANKAHHRASLILRTFKSRDRYLLFKAFTVYVRPLLEYCSPVWAPVYKTDIDIIERVQRRCTKRLFGLSSLSYVERLSVLGAETLELRRLKFDLLMMFKIIHNFVSIDFGEFFALNNYNHTRGHCFKLVKPLCNNNSRQFSFACRRIDVWNSLPAHVVSNTSVYSFKLGLKCQNFKLFLKN